MNFRITKLNYNAFFYKGGDAEDPKVFSDHSYCLPQPPGALGSTSAPEKVPKGKKARDDGRTAASSPLRNKENTSVLTVKALREREFYIQMVKSMMNFPTF